MSDSSSAPPNLAAAASAAAAAAPLLPAPSLGAWAPIFSKTCSSQYPFTHSAILDRGQCFLTKNKV
jgi:hypothetical protein